MASVLTRTLELALQIRREWRQWPRTVDCALPARTPRPIPQRSHIARVAVVPWHLRAPRRQRQLPLLLCALGWQAGAVGILAEELPHWAIHLVGQQTHILAHRLMLCELEWLQGTSRRDARQRIDV
jgi:hypothetical protein